MNTAQSHTNLAHIFPRIEVPFKMHGRTSKAEEQL